MTGVELRFSSDGATFNPKGFSGSDGLLLFSKLDRLDNI